MNLCLSQLILRKFTVREMRQRLVAKPSLHLGPCLNLALREEAIELIAEPNVEAGIVKARHLEINLTVVEALEAADIAAATAKIEAAQLPQRPSKRPRPRPGLKVAD